MEDRKRVPPIKRWVKKEMVLVISALLAIISMFLVPPDAEYLHYIDFSVLAVLFCLMAVVAGFQKIGIFSCLSSRLLQKTNQIKWISILFVALCFFGSMLITNDVALITFVPLTIELLRLAGTNRMIFVVAMETVAANLGSMVTPVGNPQNLYLYTYYHMDITTFLQTMLPLGVVSMVLVFGTMLFLRNGSLHVEFRERGKISVGYTVLYCGLFVICILAVLHVISYYVCFAAVLAAILIIDRRLLLTVDYNLLLTFCCFFILVGNVGRIEVVKQTVTSWLSGQEMLLSALLCQGISNVPAAIMLAPFTQEATALLKGVNIGGLGTLVASLASLISFRLYVRTPGAKAGRYLGVFTFVNVLFLAVLLAVGAWI